MPTFYNGYDKIIYFNIDGSDIPVGCLTSHSFSESSDVIETTISNNAGWKTFKPTNQSWSLSFEGIQVLTASVNPTKYSYDYLKTLKRNKVLINCKFELNGVFEDIGQAYISEISETASSNELLTFSVNMIGFSNPGIIDITANLLLYENSINFETISNGLLELQDN